MSARLIVVAFAAVLGGGLLVASAEEPSTGARVGGTVEEGAKTGGRTAWEGMKTFGRATAGFFTGGTAGAKKAWREGEVKTKEEARAGARATRRAADGGTAGGEAPGGATTDEAPAGDAPGGEVAPPAAPGTEAPAGK